VLQQRSITKTEWEDKGAATSEVQLCEDYSKNNNSIAGTPGLVVVATSSDLDSWLIQFLDNKNGPSRNQMLQSLLAENNTAQFWQLASGSTGTPNVVPVRRMIGALLGNSCTSSNQSRLFSDTDSRESMTDIVRLSLQVMQSKIKSFLHVSKSGGSWLCRCAKEEGHQYSVPQKDNSCWSRELADGPRWIPATSLNLTGNATINADKIWWLDSFRQKPSCAKRYKIASRFKWALLMNENYMQTTESVAADPSVPLKYNKLEEIPCTQFSHSIQFRQPMERLLSHYRHFFNTKVLLTKKLRVRAPCSVAEMAKLMPSVSNNYYIRSILGKSVWKLGLGLVNRTHLHQAKQSLIRHFDAVLVLEEEPLRFFTMQTMLGLNGSMCSLVDKRNSTKLFGLDDFAHGAGVNADTTAVALDCQREATLGMRDGNKSMAFWSRFHNAVTRVPGEWESLQSLNELDMELYAFARDIGKLDRMALEWALD